MEQALRTFGPKEEERWEKIQSAVPTRTKRECEFTVIDILRVDNIFLQLIVLFELHFFRYVPYVKKVEINIIEFYRHAPLQGASRRRQIKEIGNGQSEEAGGLIQF